MDDEILDSLTGYLPFLESCTWSNDGEFFAARNLESVFKLAKTVSSEARNGFITNGMGLYEFAEQIVAGSFSFIIVSIDAVDPEIYRKIRKGGSVDKVINGIRKVRELAERSGRSIDLRFAFVSMKLNLGELPKLVDLAASLGVKSIQVLPLNVNATAGLSRLSLDGLLDLEKADFRTARERAATRGIGLHHPHETRLLA